MTTYAYWIRGREHADMAALSIASVRALDPQGRFWVGTDDAETTPHIDGTERGVFERGRPAMVANLDAQIAILGTVPYGERVLFLDADTLVRKPFPWEPGADLYVTWRTHVNGDREMARRQPYNYGVLGTVASIRSFEAFIWLRARILQMTPRHQEWYGNQLALAALVGAPHDQDIVGITLRWTLFDRGTALLVRQLACDEWNYSPDSATEDVTGKGILHLKGERKAMMQAYSEAA